MPGITVQRRFWRILVILAPLALAGGIWLIYHRGGTAGVRFSTSRAHVVQSLQTIAADRGWETGEWNQLVDLKSQNTVRHYVQTAASPEERAGIAIVEPPVLWRVRLVSNSSPQRTIRGDFDPSGRLVAYRIPPKEAGASVPEDVALQAARQELARRLGREGGSYERTATGSARDTGTGVETRQFAFRRTFSSDLSVDVTVETAGADVVGFVVRSHISPDYSQRHLELTMVSKATRGIVIGLMTLAGFIYVMTRFIARWREQEIPVKRSVIVALIVVLSFAMVSSVSMATQNIETLDAGNATSDIGVYIGMLMVAIFFGIMLGVTWGACEADLREAYPQKLTSTDSALSGLLAARPVRTSLAAALTIACYAVLLTGLEAAARASLGIWAATADGELLSLYAPRPALFVTFLSLSGVTSSVALFIAAVSITHRKGATRRAQLLTAAVVVIFMLSSQLGTHSVFGWGVVPALISAALLLVPFFAADLLAVITVTVVSVWASSAATLLAQPAPALHSAGFTLLLLLGALVAAVAIATLRIRATNVEAVRPEYARNISERLSLAAELSTAREAQFRVMPRVVPSIPGLEIAVRHSDDAEIGTDYFEFFPGARSIGIAVADARLEGLSSALCISMLKGLLLNYAQRLDDPEETVARVRKHLESVFGNDIPLSLYYGVFDRTASELRSATLGDAPRAIVVGREGAEAQIAGIKANTAEATVVVCSSALQSVADPEDTIVGELAASPRTDPSELAASVAARARRIHPGGQRSWTVVAFRPNGAGVA